MYSLTNFLITSNRNIIGNINIENRNKYQHICKILDVIITSKYINENETYWKRIFLTWKNIGCLNYINLKDQLNQKSDPTLNKFVEFANYYMIEFSVWLYEFLFTIMRFVIKIRIVLFILII